MAVEIRSKLGIVPSRNLQSSGSEAVKLLGPLPCWLAWFGDFSAKLESRRRLLESLEAVVDAQNSMRTSSVGVQKAQRPRLPSCCMFHVYPALASKLFNLVLPNIYLSIQSTDLASRCVRTLITTFPSWVA